MAPTMVQVDSQSRGTMDRVPVSSAPLKSNVVSPRDPVDIFISLDDDNSCETYFCSRDTCPSVRSVLPEASEVFREALDKLKLETSDSENKSSEKNQVKSQSASVSSSSSSKVKSSSPVKSSFFPNILPSFMSSKSSEASGNKLLKPNKASGSRRPASFGGADLVKPRTARRASHCDKRVSWADEKGSDRQLISVRLIRPRISADINLAINSPPGQSILRNTGT
uniref:Uncharacterized protein n=1 Tax=Biomphalaria glabrata TaxID=6526 RepID=A0A2C9LK68_BIOGL